MYDDEEEEKKRILELKNYETMFEKHLSLPPMISLRDNYKYFNDIFQHFDIYTTRFNSHTYQENQRYKENMLDGFNGSLYSTMLPLPVSAPMDKYIFVIDMNNTINRIMGFGFIKNKLAKQQDIRIYGDPGFNNFIYKSDFYLPIDEKIEDKWKTFIYDEFESNLFSGKAHMKRGGSFTRYPIKRMKYKHLKFLVSLFIILNPNGFNEILRL